MSKDHRAGGKMGGRHTTVIDASKPVIDYLLKHAAVTNIIAGRIKTGIGAAPQRLKLREESGCLLIMVRGGASIQEIRVFSSEIKQITDDLQRKFSRLFRQK